MTINADDFGYSQEVNDGIIEAFKKVYITQTTLMVNMPYSDTAVSTIPAEFRNKIGLHLNLTEGKPLTSRMSNCLSFCDENGYFKNAVHQVVRKRLLTKEEKSCLREEIDAQINKYKSYNLALMHIDSHHHVHVELQILLLLIPLAKDFQTMRISRNMFQTKGVKSHIKKSYKTLINKKIARHFSTVSYFGSYQDYKVSSKMEDNFEIETHPILKNNELFDIVFEKDIKFIYWDYQI